MYTRRAITEKRVENLFIRAKLLETIFILCIRNIFALLRPSDFHLTMRNRYYFLSTPPPKKKKFKREKESVCVCHLNRFFFFVLSRSLNVESPNHLLTNSWTLEKSTAHNDFSNSGAHGFFKNRIYF